MQEPIIEIKNISKRYEITHQQGGYVALRDVLTETIKSPLKFLKKKTKEIAGLEKKEIFWALKDINFEVNKGEVVGIIGSNGAGKSTLLKILSQITPPTTGEIKVRGKIGSLLEVGTGFHPELTGRENIFLNGAILGMSKKEIVEKFDNIVEFSGIGKFLDTPVKRYSSGMYVRLAFAVAAHMDPDILIIDEVLAVGDAEFQKKCLGKMDEITKTDGRTILFVSHNIEAIKKLCTKTVLLKDGKIETIGETERVVDEYIRNTYTTNKAIENISVDKGNIIFKDFLANNTSCDRNIAIPSKSILSLSFNIESKVDKKNINVGYGLRRKEDNSLILFTHAELENIRLEAENNSRIETKFNLPKISPGEYVIMFHIWVNGRLVVTEKNIGQITILPTQAFAGKHFFSSFPSVLMIDSEWKIINKINETN